MKQIKNLYLKNKDWAIRHKHTLLRVALGVLGVTLLAQVLYPSDRMLPLDRINGSKVGAMLKKDAARKLEKQLSRQKIEIFVGDTKNVYATVKPDEIGLMMSVSSAMPLSEYPWYMRLVPGSLVWFQLLQPNPDIVYQHNETTAKKFLERDLAASCVLPAKDASLKFNGKDFDVISAKEGGTCKKSDALEALGGVKPNFSDVATIRIPATITKPKVGDSEAEALAEKLLSASENGVQLSVGSKTQTIPQAEVLAWLTFSSKNSKLDFTVDSGKSKKYLTANVLPKVSKAAGTTRITTRDFSVLSKQVGATGQTLASAETLASIKNVLNGSEQTARAITAPLKPNVVYTRSYTSTSTGIAALITHYDDEHAGDFGVAFAELEGSGRSASYQSSRQFTTASTYKLFVAYGTLRNIDSGKWKWSMQVTGGRDLTKCFDDMIVKSDNACAEALLKKLGYSKLTGDIRGLGLASSGFITGDTPLTTAGDLNLFLTKLQNNTIGLKSSSRNTLISAMKRNIYRQGIPAGTSASVADKVGFLNALVHDAAIVYSTKGTYVLTIMTDGSSWANVAELTRKIEALR